MQFSIRAKGESNSRCGYICGERCAQRCSISHAELQVTKPGIREVNISVIRSCPLAIQVAFQQQ